MTKEDAIHSLSRLLEPFELHDLPDLCERFYLQHGSPQGMHPATILRSVQLLAVSPLGGEDGFGDLTWQVSSPLGLPHLRIDLVHDDEPAWIQVQAGASARQIEQAFDCIEGEGAGVVLDYVCEQLDDEDREDVFRYLATDAQEYARCLEGAQRISNSRALPALLHDAVRKGDMVAVQAALELGARATAVDRLGNTPLHVAAAAGHEELLVPLLQAGGGVNEANGLGRTPLHLAAQAGQVKACLTLLAHFADPSMKDLAGHTPMDQARLGRGYEQGL